MNELVFQTPPQLRAIQLKSLEMFEYFDAFCQEHGLLTYFCGGCCIGTLRHQGFIPWDDDVDVFMPRDDYERLWELWAREADTSRYSLWRPTRDCVTGDIMMKLCDENTTLIKDYLKDRDIAHGLTMDILPLDGYAPTAFARKMQMLHCLLFSLFCAQTVPSKHGGVVATGSRLLLAIFRGQGLRYRIWKRAEERMSRYAIKDCEGITELCAGPHYMRNRYPAAAFASAVRKPFEGYMAPIPVGYDEYLRIAFGDYMQLPPAEKQQPHHEACFCDLDTPYKAYKGIEYCVDTAGQRASDAAGC